MSSDEPKINEVSGNWGQTGRQVCPQFPMSRGPNMWKKALPFPIVLIALVLCSRALCERVPKPAQNGPGPVAYETNKKLDAPEYHNPADWWRLHHPQLLNAGDFELRECAQCHKAETHCNRCHSYIGAKLQVLPDVPMKEPYEFKKEPGKEKKDK